MRHLVVDDIRPAMERYRAFLADEYQGRDQVGVAANPDGAACYAASVRFHTSLDMDAQALHETYPGHHLQMSVALYGGAVHPVLRYVYVASMAEGWGLYTEKLADEMGLYSGDLDRLGMLSNEALRAARLMVDPGMHVLGWSREQATAYLLGSLEIQRLRHDAEQRLGERFDIQGFHDVVLGDGAVSLPMLQAAVDRWVEIR